MNYIFRTSLLFIALLTILACKSSETEKPKEPSQAQSSSASTAVQQNSNQSPSTPATPSATAEQEKYFADIFTESKSISYQGYDIEILKKSIIDKAYQTLSIDVTYAVVKKGSKVLGKFDGVYFGAGNATNFGLFNFLGNQTKELAISQTIPRGGRHWIVRLAPDYKVIFDSDSYEVSDEEVAIIDPDHDGIYEVELAVRSLDSVFDFPMSETPLPGVIFKFDKKTDSYLPANHLFQNYLLQGIDKQISELNADPKSPKYLSSRLGVLLHYLYAGKEKEGWAFFDREYALPDKEMIKTKIRNVLKKGRAFQYITNSAKKSAG